jgi:hypothetical protein
MPCFKSYANSSLPAAVSGGAPGTRFETRGGVTTLARRVMPGMVIVRGRNECGTTLHGLVVAAAVDVPVVVPAAAIA